MNKEQIIALLKSKFSGMRADTLEHLAGAILLDADNEAEVTAKVNKFTEQKLKDYEKDFRSKVDSEVTKAVQTNKEKIEKEFELVKKDVQKPEEPIKIEGLTADSIKSIVLEAVKPLNDEISRLKGDNLTKSRREQLDTILKDCKDENYKKTITNTFNLMGNVPDENFGTWIAETVTEGVKSANQLVANENLSRQGAPIDPKNYGAKGMEQAIVDAIQKGETSTAVEGKSLIPQK